jgi:hypothetical protein
VLTGHSQEWETLASAYYQLLLYVYAPTVITVGFLVGLFANRFPLAVAVLATSPASVLIFAFTTGRYALMGGGLTLSAMGAAYLATWWKSRRKTQLQRVA